MTACVQTLCRDTSSLASEICLCGTCQLDTAGLSIILCSRSSFPQHAVVQTEEKLLSSHETVNEKFLFPVQAVRPPSGMMYISWRGRRECSQFHWQLPKLTPHNKLSSIYLCFIPSEIQGKCCYRAGRSLKRNMQHFMSFKRGKASPCGIKRGCGKTKSIQCLSILSTCDLMP